MSRYDGLIIPRSYSEYINKTDAATLHQALQLSGVLSAAVAAGDNKAVKSSAVNEALINLDKLKNIVVTSDTEFWNAITSMQVNRCNSSIIIGYVTPLFNNISGGVIQCNVAEDINMIRGIFWPPYEDKIYSLLINVVLRNVNITELAKKSDLNNYQKQYTDLAKFSSDYYPATFRFELSSDFKGRFKAETYSQANELVGYIDLIYNQGELIISNQDNIGYELNSNVLYLYSNSGAYFTKYIHCDVIQGTINTAGYV